MALCNNILVLALFGSIIVTFGPLETNGAPLRQRRSSCADLEDDATAVMKNGLNVLFEVSKLSKGINSHILGGNITRVCGVIDYVNKVVQYPTNKTNLLGLNSTSNEDILKATEQIKNDTCDWVNSVSEGTIQTCTDQELEVFCLQAQVLVLSEIAAKTIQGTDKICRGQWIRNRFDDGDIKDFICSRPFLSNLC